MRNAILCLVCSLSIVAGGLDYKLITRTAKSGKPLVAIDNRGDSEIYCYISSDNYFVDFYVRPHSQGRWYVEPNGNYNWGCE